MVGVGTTSVPASFMAAIRSLRRCVFDTAIVEYKLGESDPLYDVAAEGSGDARRLEVRQGVGVDRDSTLAVTGLGGASEEGAGMSNEKLTGWRMFFWWAVFGIGAWLVVVLGAKALVGLIVWMM